MIICSESVTLSLDQFIAEHHPDKVFLLCDSHTYKHCLPAIHLSSPFVPIVIPAGEQHKNLLQCNFIWQTLANSGASRKSLLICLGGGSVSDIGGFVASTYQRGIDCIYVPTTLLAMVDAAIGGKTGINLDGLKNYIGTFQLPKAIFINPQFLQTLSPSEFRNGLAEIIKHGFLADGELFNYCRQPFPESTDTNFWTSCIQANANFKQAIISADFTENNIRAQLNFGHTAAHALESLYLVSNEILPHGRAVAAGMWIESYAGAQMGKVSQSMLGLLKTAIQHEFEKVTYSDTDIEVLNQFAGKDKKSSLGKITCSLVEEPGKPLTLVEIPDDTFTLAWKAYIHEVI